jgi:hypothetical protein
MTAVTFEKWVRWYLWKKGYRSLGRALPLLHFNTETWDELTIKVQNRIHKAADGCEL